MYGRYDKMLYRCYNPNSDNYQYYGGRGIKVCKRWKESFQNFLEDMEPSFFENAELDRIDNDKDYSPENCRWVTHSHNMLNRKGLRIRQNIPGLKSLKRNISAEFKLTKTYYTKYMNTPREAYEELQVLKKRLYSEMNIENLSNSWEPLTLSRGQS